MAITDLITDHFTDHLILRVNQTSHERVRTSFERTPSWSGVRMRMPGLSFRNLINASRCWHHLRSQPHSSRPPFIPANSSSPQHAHTHKHHPPVQTHPAKTLVQIRWVFLEPCGALLQVANLQFPAALGVHLRRQWNGWQWLALDTLSLPTPLSQDP